jgi:DNA-binding GntR family transcriptional regulator
VPWPGYDAVVAVDKLGAEPLYLQIAGELAGRIAAGDIEPGGRLPSLREICQTYGCARMTAERAVAQLRNAGQVRGVPGRGVYVLPGKARRRRPAGTPQAVDAPAGHAG